MPGTVLRLLTTAEPEVADLQARHVLVGHEIGGLDVSVDKAQLRMYVVEAAHHPAQQAKKATAAAARREASG